MRIWILISKKSPTFWTHWTSWHVGTKTQRHEVFLIRARNNMWMKKKVKTQFSFSLSFSLWIFKPLKLFLDTKARRRKCKKFFLIRARNSMWMKKKVKTQFSFSLWLFEPIELFLDTKALRRKGTKFFNKKKMLIVGKWFQPFELIEHIEPLKLLFANPHV